MTGKLRGVWHLAVGKADGVTDRTAEVARNNWLEALGNLVTAATGRVPPLHCQT